MFNAQEGQLEVEAPGQWHFTKSCPSGGAISEDQQGRRRKEREEAAQAAGRPGKRSVSVKV